MPALLAGQEPNVFSAKFSGGALMDLGIYPVYAAIRLFGAPENAYYTAQQLPSTVDLNGVGSLIYPEFQVTIQTGKNINSFFPAEIYTTDPAPAYEEPESPGGYSGYGADAAKIGRAHV